MANAIHAQMTILSFSDLGSPAITTDIGEVRTIGGPTLGADLVDVTHQKSPSGFREFIMGLQTGGEVSFDINYLPSDTTHDASTGLLSKFEGRTNQGYQLSFPDSPVVLWTFSAFLTAFSPDADPESQLLASITLGITGKPTIL